MVAPVELETSATGHEMSNQGEKPDLPQHKPGSPCKNWWLPTTSQLHFFALHNLYLRPFHTMAAGSCPKVAILAQNTVGTKWPEQHGRTSFEPCHDTCNSGTCAISKTTMVAPKTSKTITVWWLMSNLKQTPLVMQCQISKWEQVIPQENPGSQ